MSDIILPKFDVLIERDGQLIIEAMDMEEYKDWEPSENEQMVLAPINGHVGIRFEKDPDISDENPVLVPGATQIYKNFRNLGYSKVAGYNIIDEPLVNFVDGQWIFREGAHPDTERINLINKTVEQFDDTSLTNHITDGQHTFGELYHHRAVLTSLFANQVRSWEETYEHGLNEGWIDQEKYDTLTQLCGVIRSKKHADGTMFTGYFIVHFTTPTGDYSYHYPITEWDLFDNIRTVDFAPEYDGHTAENIDRLLTLQEFMTQKMGGENEEA